MERITPKFALAALTLALGACATQPLNQDKLRAHAERNCRVEAAVNREYPVDASGRAGATSIAYQACMRRAGFPVDGSR